MIMTLFMMMSCIQKEHTPRTPETPRTPITLPLTFSQPPRKSTQGRGIKIFPLKQMLQRLLIVFAQVQAGNMSENLLNKIQEIVYSLYQPKQISKNF